MRNLPGRVRRAFGMETHKPAPTNVMNDEDWRAAVVLAHAKLCQGTDGFFVEIGEPWVLALIRVAGLLLEDKGWGRRHGERIRDEWANFVTDVARRSSTAPDGCIAVGESGLRTKLGSYPRGVSLVS